MIKHETFCTVGKRVVEIVPIVVVDTAVVIYVTTVECAHFRIMGSWKQEKSTFVGLFFYVLLALLKLLFLEMREEPF